jgi:hypothetical protein
MLFEYCEKAMVVGSLNPIGQQESKGRPCSLKKLCNEGTYANQRVDIVKEDQALSSSYDLAPFPSPLLPPLLSVSSMGYTQEN